MGIYQELEKEYDYDIVEEFFGHYSIMVDNLEKLIIDLENPSLYSRNINELFRIFHTIKSAASYLKITPILKIVTLAEDILEECRNLEGSASEALINWLLAIHDQLGEYREDLEKDRDTFTSLDKKIIKVPTEYLRT